MNDHLFNIPVSVLDLAIIKEGGNAAEAFNESLLLAQSVESLGYNRFWLAEHHNMASVASSATSILIGHIASGTSTIRVGSGGIMLPNHAPLIVTEQFGTLASLFPGRIDLGLGRAPGTDQQTAMAIRQDRLSAVNEFPNHVQEIMQYLSPENKHNKVRAIPGEGLDIPIWILGSSIQSARLASYFGLPYAFASHFAPSQFMDALYIYRKDFRPSTHLKEPYVMACVNVMAADTDEEADQIATSFYQMALGIIKQQSYPLKAPVRSMENLWTEHEEAAVKGMMAYSFIGSENSLKVRMENFLEETKVNEIMAVSHIFSHKARIRSYEILAKIFDKGFKH